MRFPQILEDNEDGGGSIDETRQASAHTPPGGLFSRDDSFLLRRSPEGLPHTGSGITWKTGKKGKGGNNWRFTQMLHD